MTRPMNRFLDRRPPWFTTTAALLITKHVNSGSMQRIRQPSRSLDVLVSVAQEHAPSVRTLGVISKELDVTPAQTARCLYTLSDQIGRLDWQEGGEAKT